MTGPTLPRPRAASREPNGFTLIELLVVVSFIAILASIAIQRFPTVRETAHDAAVKSDLQNALRAEEAFFVDSNRYAAFTVADGGESAAPEFDASPGVTITATVPEAGKVRIVGSHGGTSKTWCVSTESGGVVEGSTC